MPAPKTGRSKRGSGKKTGATPEDPHQGVRFQGAICANPAGAQLVANEQVLAIQAAANVRAQGRRQVARPRQRRPLLTDAFARPSTSGWMPRAAELIRARGRPSGRSCQQNGANPRFPLVVRSEHHTAARTAAWSARQRDHPGATGLPNAPVVCLDFWCRAAWKDLKSLESPTSRAHGV